MRGPVRAGRFLIHGSHSPVARNRYSIEIDASTAFGTAHHASTRGCLLALDALLKRTRPARIVDIGTGSGILAIAAAKALQTRVLASDNDPVAARIAADNARKNGVGGLVRVVEADGLAHPLLRGAVRPAPRQSPAQSVARARARFRPRRRRGRVLRAFRHHRSASARGRGTLRARPASRSFRESFSMDGRACSCGVAGKETRASGLIVKGCGLTRLPHVPKLR